MHCEIIVDIYNVFIIIRSFATDIVGMCSNIEVFKKLKLSTRNYAAVIKSVCSNSLRFRSEKQNPLKMSTMKMPTPSELKVG